jgi:hypothetical protein
MRNFIAGIFAALIAATGLGVTVWIVVLPRIDWGASNPPGMVEQAVATQRSRALGSLRRPHRHKSYRTYG